SRGRVHRSCTYVAAWALKSFEELATGAASSCCGRLSNQRPAQPERVTTRTVAATRHPAGRKADRLCAYFMFLESLNQCPRGGDYGQSDAGVQGPVRP